MSLRALFSMYSQRVSRVVPGLILGALSLLSAFLLFQVQPIISKFILPWFGGSPGVWTTCMVFFQVVLFAGYAYAHALTRLPRKWQGIIHGVLLGLAIALLPIAPGDGWKPTGAEDPALRILLLLGVSVGLPYFVLSSTSPLVQVWFTRASSGAGNPWRLYALSNIGSLAALLSYPLFFEVRWDVLEQTTLWTFGFAAFVLLSLSGIWLDRKQAAGATEQPSTGTPGQTADDLPPSWGRRLLWVLLPALASCMLLSATNHVCQDVAVIPFLWVVPLSLYLLTFIICFEHERWYSRVTALWALPALLASLVACVEDQIRKKAFWVELEKHAQEHWAKWLEKKTDMAWDFSKLDLTPNYLWELGWSFGAMFFGCMLCHGELTRLKPAPRRLTEFYLLMSAGGALGGLFVSLGAPRLFTTFVEWPLSLIFTFIIAGLVLLCAVWKIRSAWQWVILAALVVVAALTGVSGHQCLEWSQQALREAAKEDIVLPMKFIWSLMGGIAVCVLILGIRAAKRGFLFAPLLSLLLLCALVSLGVLGMAEIGFLREEKLERTRNFYGMLSVTERKNVLGGPYSIELTNGGIVHGMQLADPNNKSKPTTYYNHESGIGRALDSLRTNPTARVGIVGMGAGTVSCYAQTGQTYRFYDINPDVVRIAQKHFTYLADLQARGANLEIVVADARLAMERERSQGFDVLLLDAFSGDSVPVHLLTREAFDIYQRHMRPDGIIAVHITNTYLVLAPVVEKIAKEIGYKTTRIATAAEGDQDSTDYILVTNNTSFLAAHPESLVGDEKQLKHDVRLWTDRYHNLLNILDIPWNVKSSNK